MIGILKYLTKVTVALIIMCHTHTGFAAITDGTENARTPKITAKNLFDLVMNSKETYDNSHDTHYKKSPSGQFYMTYQEQQARWYLENANEFILRLKHSNAISAEQTNTTLIEHYLLNRTDLRITRGSWPIEIVAPYFDSGGNRDGTYTEIFYLSLTKSEQESIYRDIFVKYAAIDFILLPAALLVAQQIHKTGLSMIENSPDAHYSGYKARYCSGQDCGKMYWGESRSFLSVYFCLFSLAKPLHSLDFTNIKKYQLQPSKAGGLSNAYKAD